MQAQLQVTSLRCEYSINPLGVETATPQLSWQLHSTQKNVLQAAYKILVSDDSLQLKKSLASIWNSDKIQSATSIQITYAGKPLQASKKYFWKVQVWDNKGNMAESAIAFWQMGLLKKDDLPAGQANWSNAKWIGYDEPVDSLRIHPHVHQSGKKKLGPKAECIAHDAERIYSYKKNKISHHIYLRPGTF